MSELSREQFARTVIEIVRGRFPLVQVARARQPFALQINGGVFPLEHLYRRVMLEPTDFKRQIERWAVELIRAGEGSPDRVSDLDAVRDRILPMLISDHTEHDLRSMARQPLVCDLHVSYVIDADRTVAYIPRAMVERWALEIEDLHQIALANLVTRSGAIEFHAASDEHGRLRLLICQTMDGYDAARLLLPALYERLAPELGGVFCAAVPNRDILLCFRNEADVVDSLRKQIGEDFRRMPHQLTDRLLLVTPDGIAPRD